MSGRNSSVELSRSPRSPIATRSPRSPQSLHNVKRRGMNHRYPNQKTFKNSSNRRRDQFEDGYKRDRSRRRLSPPMRRMDDDLRTDEESKVTFICN